MVSPLEAPPSLLLSPVPSVVQPRPPSEASTSTCTGTNNMKDNDDDDDDAAALLALRNGTNNRMEPAVPIPAAVVVDATVAAAAAAAAPEANSSSSSNSTQSLADSTDRQGPSPLLSPMELEESPIVDNNNNNDNSLSSISTTNRSVDDSLLSTPPSSRRSSMIGPQQQQQHHEESSDGTHNGATYNNNNNNNNNNNHSHYSQYPGTENEARIELELILSQSEGWKDSYHDSGSAAADNDSSQDNSTSNHDDFEMVIDSLVRFPGLAAQVFADADGNGYYPLVHLMFASANRNVLFEIAKMWPPVLLVRQGKDQSLPLHLACSRLEGADDVIYSLTNWNSDALQQYNGTGLLPIHCALIKHMFFQGPPSTFSAIKYLLDMNPSTALMQTTTGGYSCLDLAVQGGFDVFVLDYIIMTQQQQLALLQPKRPQKKQPYPQESNKEETQQPEPLATFVVPNDFLRQPICINLDKAFVLERILHKHQVQHLECVPALWENREALQYFIKCLQNSPPATTRLNFRFPPSLLNSVCRFTFQQALEENTVLRRLALICADEDSFKDSTDFLNSLRVGLANNATLNALTLRHFKGNLLDLCLKKNEVSKTATPLATTLPTKVSALRTLELSQAEFTDNPEDYVLPPLPPLAISAYAYNNNNTTNVSQIQSLRIFSCTITPPCLQLLLEGLARLPSLQELLLEVLGPDLQKPGTLIERDPAASTLAATDTITTAKENGSNPAETRQPYDMTAPLVAIVAQGKLKKLSIGCYPLVQVAAFCEELKTNTSLISLHAPYMFVGKEAKLLNVLAQHNTHLRNVQTNPMNVQSRAIEEKINHFTTLNFCGRGRTRDDSLTRSEFVDLLCGVALHVNNAIANGAAKEAFLQQKHSLLFGLLRESPNQWSLESDGSPCISPNSRKRRRKDHDAAVAA